MNSLANPLLNEWVNAVSDISMSRHELRARGLYTTPPPPSKCAKVSACLSPRNLLLYYYYNYYSWHHSIKWPLFKVYISKSIKMSDAARTKTIEADGDQLYVITKIQAKFCNHGWLGENSGWTFISVVINKVTRQLWFLNGHGGYKIAAIHYRFLCTSATINNR